MTKHAVVIAGGGPTGLMLSGELALAGVDVAIVERRASQELVPSRAGGLHSRTIEVFDRRGIADRFLAQGQVAQVAGLVRTPSSLAQRLPGSFVRGLANDLAEWTNPGGLSLPNSSRNGTPVVHLVQKAPASG